MTMLLSQEVQIHLYRRPISSRDAAARVKVELVFKNSATRLRSSMRTPPKIFSILSSEVVEEKFPGLVIGISRRL